MNSFYLCWFPSLLETFYVPFWARKEIAFVKQFHKLEKKQKRIKIVGPFLCFPTTVRSIVVKLEVEVNRAGRD